VDANWENINPLMGTGNCSATSNNTKLVNWPLIHGLLHLVQQGGHQAGCSPARHLTVPNVTAHPSTASVPITVLLYNGRLLCIKGLRQGHTCKFISLNITYNTCFQTHLYLVLSFKMPDNMQLENGHSK